ncbi:Threo-3-hydroxyaspartate ammonia-lyase [Serratia sp. AS12]|uniref:threo-3-hydroxy-L-aspartate ammonia-lyase n=1 Tax=Serratia TaxID=613 RepID=UPI00020E932D|nr:MULTISPECIES: threo-3-hydroxy-L-aspartate ammonia-lyase [Serratia]AEF45077.1 Threo-3-hydroxyaspartate ammonia-lyase [Serratia plymuthica AS9]AEF50028.1 Threo-3-hydroxyaspartate ammonia-lyase [Serratia sp. AS12]AEG27735.1 Threo-3-hydroxyaspartate ammonia-lyase [Serratia sp. AS13]UTN98563.1 threo-3-hydroxy-L-aspartate ammonia-lyase [Serratia plymuthica]
MSSTPHCITAADISTAAEILAGHAIRTPVMTSHQADNLTGAKLFFKCENFQRVGAFKFRGAYNAIAQLSEAQRKAGVIAFSSGNHAQAMALAARELGVNVTIVMPNDAPETKLAATRGYGANVVIYQRHSENREEITQQLAAEHGLAIVPPYDYPQVMAGQGTATKELIEEVGPLDVLLVSTGGGGLLSGSAIAARHWSPGCRVYGVEPQAGNDVQQAFRSGQPVRIPVPKTIADGAQTQQVGTLTFPIIQQYVEDILTVTDAQLCRQMRFFMERMKMVVEPTGCLAAAAAMNSLLDLRGKKVGVIVSGGNVDVDKIAQYLAIGAQE